MKREIEITRRDTENLDYLEHMRRNAGIRAQLTTEHPRSSYGQPIVLVEGQVIDYSAIESILLRECTDEDFETAKGLEAFGIHVTRT